MWFVHLPHVLRLDALSPAALAPLVHGIGGHMARSQSASATTVLEGLDATSLLPSVGSGYRLVRRIKRGGMAEVFEALRLGAEGFERRVAIKRPHALTEPGTARAFADEARILSRLVHPNIVGVFDFGVHAGWPFQVLEYVDGLDLHELHMRARARGRPIDAERALWIAAQVAEALHAAHRAVDEDGCSLKIVHRDVSPQNVLISWGGEIKLSDFGIAFADRRETKTEKGVVKGNLGFMSPEQLMGAHASPATDIFSLGCVIVAALTGRTPLDSWQARKDAIEGRLDAAEDLPRGVAEIVKRATSADPQQRYRNARDMAAACRAAIADPHGLTERFREWLSSLRDEARVRSPFVELFAVPRDASSGGTETPVLPISVEELSESAPTTRSGSPVTPPDVDTEPELEVEAAAPRTSVLPRSITRRITRARTGRFLLLFAAAGLVALVAVLMR